MSFNFQYKADGWLDSWRFINKTLYGDCDDFAVSEALFFSGSKKAFWFDVLIFKTQFYWCRDTTGTAHIIFWRWGKGWLDNQNPYWREKPVGMTRRIYIPIPIVALKMLIGKVCG